MFDRTGAMGRASRLALLFAALAPALALAAGGRAAVHAKVTPVQKVVLMLKDEAAKVQAEKNEGEASFATFMQFCKSTREEKSKSIGEGQDEIEQLKADIQKAGADAMMLSQEIAGHDSDIAAWTEEKKKASDIRDKENADFHSELKEYVDSISSTEQALASLQQGASFIQMKSSLHRMLSSQRVPTRAKQVAISFLQRDASDRMFLQQSLETVAPEAAAFESSSGGIIDMVKDLKAKLKDEKTALEKEESTAAYEFSMKVQDLVSNIDSATSERDMKIGTKAKRKQDKSECEGMLEDTKTTLAEDEKTFSDLNDECEKRSSEWEQEQVLRAGELKAINSAIEIMSSDKVAGGTQHLPGLVQTSLLQVRTESKTPLQGQAALFLKARAQQQNSQILSLLAIRVSSDPFKKVTKMIKDMITKLMEEANEEAEHKGFCDTEMGVNKKTRDTKTEEVETLTADASLLGADVERLTTEVATLAEAIADNDAAMKKATSIRNAEKKANAKVIDDAKIAEDATASALAVLNGFYESGASLLQTSQRNAGIIGMLEVIESDFVRLQSDTRAGESEAQRIFDKFSSDSAADKAVKAASVKNKEDYKQEKVSALASTQKDLQQTQEELDAALVYFEKLKPSCVEAGESAGDRVARRQEEIESLKDALKILSE